MLLQEAFRADASVPASHGFAGPPAPFLPRTVPRADIAEIARELRLNLRYVPSMRNGGRPSDRGNAILSDAAARGARAIELPLVLQRRVALAATVAMSADCSTS